MLSPFQHVAVRTARAAQTQPLLSALSCKKEINKALLFQLIELISTKSQVGVPSWGALQTGQRWATAGTTLPSVWENRATASVALATNSTTKHVSSHHSPKQQYWWKDCSQSESSWKKSLPFHFYEHESVPKCQMKSDLSCRQGCTAKDAPSHRWQ